MDTETKRYVDASMRAVKAETDAEFTKIMAKLDSQPKPPPLSQIIGVAVSTVIAVFAILGFSSDRFDGGISASAIVDEALRQIIAQQEIRDASQDARLDRVLAALEALQTTDPNAPGGNN